MATGPPSTVAGAATTGSPDTRAEGFDWNTRTGQFAYMRIDEDRQRLLEDDRLRNHDAGI